MECRGGKTQAQIAVEPALEGGALRIVVAEQIDALDRRLSRDRSDACASCHNPKRAFSDPANCGRGRRNAPALINQGYGRAFF